MLRKIFAALFLLITATLLLTLTYDVWNNPMGFSSAVFPYLSVLMAALLAAFMARRLKSKLNFTSWIGSIIIFIVTSIMAIFSVAVIYVDYKLQDQSYDEVYNDCYKVWAARGLVNGGHEIMHTGEQNSIESIGRAFRSGAHGTEVDVFYDTTIKKFIVSHDYPYNLKNGAILPMESLFAATGNSNNYWLDFKRIRHLDDQQLADSVKELQRLADKFDLKKRLYVEGEAPISLAAYREAGFFTIFDTHPLNDDHFLAQPVINLYKLVYYFGNFSVMGMNYNFGHTQNPVYGPMTQRLLGNIPVFIYHIQDDAEVLQKLANMKAVRVMLVLHHNLNRYNLNACN
jgi:hypothetical protein